MRRKYEQPQRGNPHQLRIRQHVWPAKSIARFGDREGRVQLFDKVRNTDRKAKPDDDIFCVARAWDERAEAGYMRTIEDDFQALADEIIAGTLTTIDTEQKGKIDAFFALWTMRADFKTADPAAIPLRGVTGKDWSKDQEEQLEKRGIGFLRENGTMPARVINGATIQRRIDGLILGALANVQWGIIHLQEGLVVPDYPAYTVIPLTPTIALHQGQSDTITKQSAAELNHSLRSASRDYFFAQDLTQCP